MHNVNANENDRLMETADAIVKPILEAGTPTESGSILSGLVEASDAGLTVVPVVPALALVQ